MMSLNAIFEIGFLMGLIGSVHCIGMCGPLVMALPIAQQTNFQKWQSILLYHAGKISSYTILGILLGLFGSQLPLYGVQENLSMVMGSIMLLYVVYVFVIKPKFIHRFLQFNLLYTFIVKKMGQLFRSKNRAVFYFIGILNGLLPCGMIYVALTSALATQNILQGGLIMTFFGIGTMPALIMIAIGGQYFSITIRKKIQNLLPIFIFTVGVLLILRGMNLGIPFISPHLGIGVDKISCHN
jgi:sulfite exporter TauE/SafE